MTSQLTKVRGKIFHSDPEPEALLGSLMSEEAAQYFSQLDSGQKVKDWKASSCVVSVLECQMWDRRAPPRSERFDSRWSTNPPPDRHQVRELQIISVHPKILSPSCTLSIIIITQWCEKQRLLTSGIHNSYFLQHLSLSDY